MNAYIEKAEILTEALPFIQQFRGETVVVKFGGSIMENEVGVRTVSYTHLTLPTIYSV